MIHAAFYSTKYKDNALLEVSDVSCIPNGYLLFVCLNTICIGANILWTNAYWFLFTYIQVGKLLLHESLFSRDVNEPLQARGSTRSARKFRCSKVARLEIGSKIFGSIFARLEKCSKNFGSRSTLFEIFRLEMLASLKRANFWKKLQGIYCQYCTWNQF